MATFDYRSRRWRRFRREMIDRADHRCSTSGCNQRWGLNAHHVISPLRAPELAYDPTNIRVYCTLCHARVSGWDAIPYHFHTSDMDTVANDAQFEFPFGDTG